jgi:diguanylate cyclase (GGDEF)-like protein
VNRGVFRINHDVRAGLYLASGNCIVTAIVFFFVFSTGDRVGNIDLVDLIFEGGSMMISLATFALVSIIRVSVTIKAPFLLGLFLNQIGRTLDAMDEVVLVDVPHWSATGDGLAFFGELFVVYAATRWIISSYKLSMTDKLTSLYNRHYLERAFEKATLFRRAQDTHGIHLIILDVDDFKKINDHFGHLIGDNVLVALSELLKNNTRPKDIVARQGGEEFEILLPESDRITALKIAVMRSLSGSNISNSSPPWRATISFGRVLFLSSSLKATKTLSPIKWPKWSFIFLKSSTSSMIK